VHQEGPIPRTGAINSIERAQKLVANPNPIPKFPMAENYQKHEVNSDVKVSSQTVSRTHPTNPTDMLMKRSKKDQGSTGAELTPTRQGQPVRAQPADEDKGPKGFVVLPAKGVADGQKEGKKLTRT